jgi:DNA-binding transcriptional LysR family regulator
MSVLKVLTTSPNENAIFIAFGVEGNSRMNGRDLPELTAFVAAADHLSVRAAASRLHVTPSALSHSMRQLEERLGVRLLHRTTRSVSVTNASLLLLERQPHRTAHASKATRILSCRTW